MSRRMPEERGRRFSRGGPAGRRPNDGNAVRWGTWLGRRNPVGQSPGGKGPRGTAPRQPSLPPPRPPLPPGDWWE